MSMILNDKMLIKEKDIIFKQITQNIAYLSTTKIRMYNIPF